MVSSSVGLVAVVAVSIYAALKVDLSLTAADNAMLGIMSVPRLMVSMGQWNTSDFGRHQSFRSLTDTIADVMLYAAISAEPRLADPEWLQLDRSEYPRRDGSVGEIAWARPGPGSEKPNSKDSPRASPDERIPSDVVVVFFHGGGMVVGRADNFVPRRLALKLGVAVASVEYRLAPENPYPVPLHDCYDAVAHVHANAAAMGFNPARVVVAGVSAGGLFATAVSLMARDEGLSPPLLMQVPIVPVVLYGHSTPSYANYGNYGTLSMDVMQMFWAAYTRSLPLRTDNLACFNDAYCSPGSADDLSGMPPTLAVWASADVLRDEALGYVMRLLKAGVNVTRYELRGTHVSTIGTDAFNKVVLPHLTRLIIEFAETASAATPDSRPL